jgi:hypothetical protein
MPANHPGVLDAVLISIHPTYTSIFLWLAEILFDIIVTYIACRSGVANEPSWWLFE